MNKKYTNTRPSIPATTRRAVAIESGHACAVKLCNEHTYNEYHHIDGNRENNDPSNLIYLCDKHHKMAHGGEIDKTALRDYKKINSNNHSNSISTLPQASEEAEKRKRDIYNVTWVISTIHFQTLDNHINDLPRVIRAPIFHFWESFNGVMTNSLFYLYDNE